MSAVKMLKPLPLQNHDVNHVIIVHSLLFLLTVAFLNFWISVTPTCSNDVVNTTWLGQMGYTFKKQLPNWLISSTDKMNSRVPVGGGVNYYCVNSAKRPKQDQNDGDRYDGIISTHCTHTGIMNISMNPAGKVQSFSSIFERHFDV
jgi:hypothetical protein